MACKWEAAKDGRMVAWENKRIVLGCLLYLFSVTDNTLATTSNSHQPRTLRSDELRKVAQWSDGAEQQEYFEDTLLDPMLKVRLPDTPGNREVQEHISDHMSSFGWHIEYDSFLDDTPHGLKTFTNILATQNPQSPKQLVIACHFDSKYYPDKYFIGAMGSAVPCAMMLDLARLMNSTLWANDARKHPPVGLQFFFFDGHEAFNIWTDTDSLYGSRHLATALAKKSGHVDGEETIDTIDVLVLLDLIGSSSTQFHNWFTETDKLFQRLQKIESKLIKEDLIKYSPGSRKYFRDSTYRGGGIEDDHIPFLQRGVPILHLISYPFPKEWHTEADNEKALDFKTIENLGKILRIFVAEQLHLAL